MKTSIRDQVLVAIVDAHANGNVNPKSAVRPNYGKAQFKQAIRAMREDGLFADEMTGVPNDAGVEKATSIASGWLADMNNRQPAQMAG